MEGSVRLPGKDRGSGQRLRSKRSEAVVALALVVVAGPLHHARHGWIFHFPWLLTFSLVPTLGPSVSIRKSDPPWCRPLLAVQCAHGPEPDLLRTEIRTLCLPTLVVAAIAMQAFCGCRLASDEPYPGPYRGGLSRDRGTS